jgi:alpha/beta superfamily hydrolase
MKNAVGQQDAGDVSHVIEYLHSKMTESIRQSEHQDAVAENKIKIGVVGYSFGAALASCGLDHPSVHAMVAISFPLGLVTKLLGTEKYLDKLCNAPSHVNRLLVIGAQDQYTNIGKLKVKVVESGGRIFQNFSTSASLEESMMVLDKVVDSMLLPVSSSSSISNTSTNPMCLQVFESNDHFWSSDCALMVEFVIKYLSNLFVAVVAD